MKQLKTTRIAIFRAAACAWGLALVTQIVNNLPFWLQYHEFIIPILPIIV